MDKIKFEVKYKGLLSLGYEAKDISNMDIDEIIYSGAYYGYNIINAPDINYIQAIVTRHNEDWIVQECIDYLDKVYLRAYKNGEWSEWTELVPTHNCGEPDKEIIIVERPHSHPIATPQNAGFMSAEDKKKLNALTNDFIDLNFEKRLENIEQDIDNINELKADKTHNHDDVYLPAFSYKRPSYQNKRGQIWIHLQN